MTGKKPTPEFNVSEFKELVHKRGGVSKIARELGVSRQAVYNYMYGSRTPVGEINLKIEELK